MNGIGSATIRWVCLSDLHFGEEGSLLTARVPGTVTCAPECPSAVMEQLVKCLEALLPDSLSPRPTLVLAGDALGLAVAPDNEAYMVLRCFLELTMKRPTPLFSRIVYIPGNHDHHVWETTRELEYSGRTLSKLGAGDRLPSVGHTTPAFEDPSQIGKGMTSQVLVALLGEVGVRDVDVTVAYPNYSIVAPGSPGRAVIFTHGHYMDDSYTEISRILRWAFPQTRFPERFEELEQENFAYIDFIWSAVGRSGKVGDEIEYVWSSLQSEKLEDDLAGRLADGFVSAHNVPVVPDMWERAIDKELILGLLKRFNPLRRQPTTQVPGGGTVSGMKKFVLGPLAKQIGEERGQAEPPNENLPLGQTVPPDLIVPPDLTLVFGHTHQPFAGTMTFGGSYPAALKVLNTGGWVLDGPQPKPEQGAAILLLDEELNAALIRMYNDGAGRAVVIEPGVPDPAFGGASGVAPVAPNPLSEALHAAINVQADPWATFSETVISESQTRRQVAVGS